MNENENKTYEVEQTSAMSSAVADEAAGGAVENVAAGGVGGAALESAGGEGAGGAGVVGGAGGSGVAEGGASGSGVSGKSPAAGVGAQGGKIAKAASKKNLIKIGIIAVAVVIIAVLAGVGISSAMDAENRENIEFYKTHIFDKTTAGGVDISKMTPEEAAEAVNAALADMSVDVVDGADRATFKASDAKVSEVPLSYFEDMLAAQDSEQWKEGCGAKEDATLPELKYDLGALEAEVSKMDCVSGASRHDAVDAQLKMEGGEFEIVPGSAGDRVDADVLTDLVASGITGGKYEGESAGELGESPYKAELDALDKAKADLKELRLSFVDEDRDGWDDKTDVIIADATAEAQAKVDAAEEALKAAKEARKSTGGTYAGRTIKIEGVSAASAKAADIQASQYYEQPIWTGTEPEFTAAQEKADKWLGAEIDYTIDMIPHAAKVDAKVIQNFIVVNQDKIDVELDEDAIKAWLRETCKDYDTVGTTRTYTTPSGDTISLSGGHYGWMTDEAAELPKLVASIEAGEKVSRDMSYSSTADGPKGGQEWGNTYIDVDRSAQLITYVVDGSVVYTADTVTGSSDAAHETQTGYWSIIWKDSPHVMVGDIDPSTGEPEYRTPCDYFLCFNGNGSAIHDADHIRSNWSKSAWRAGAGSHGCCNCHYSDAQYFYNNVAYGTPVIVHD